jgi:dTDP-4-dehydrorhamnose 3,5-epimerase-like enzyme
MTCSVMVLETMATELHQTAITGVIELVGQPFHDLRGAFLNAFRRQESVFAMAWGDRNIAQVNLSFTKLWARFGDCTIRPLPTVRRS